MTDTVLGEFEGRDVLATSVKVTNAGDGLSAALGVDPQLLHHGDRGAIVIEYEVSKITHDPVKDTDGLTRVHTLKAIRGTLVDLEFVRDKLDAQTRRIEEAEGTLRLDLDGDGEGRGGEPVPIGDVLNDAIDLADHAEDDTAWREGRRSELREWTKDVLIVELRDEHEVTPPSSATKPELVDLMLDAEAARRG